MMRLLKWRGSGETRSAPTAPMTETRCWTQSIPAGAGTGSPMGLRVRRSLGPVAPSGFLSFRRDNDEFTPMRSLRGRGRVGDAIRAEPTSVMTLSPAIPPLGDELDIPRRRGRVCHPHRL